MSNHKLECFSCGNLYTPIYEQDSESCSCDFCGHEWNLQDSVNEVFNNIEENAREATDFVIIYIQRIAEDLSFEIEESQWFPEGFVSEAERIYQAEVQAEFQHMFDEDERLYNEEVRLEKEAKDKEAKQLELDNVFIAKQLHPFDNVDDWLNSLPTKESVQWTMHYHDFYNGYYSEEYCPFAHHVLKHMVSQRPSAGHFCGYCDSHHSMGQCTRTA